MPKIVSVKVWGFQSWVNGQYDLVDGLNVFTGPSGSGKTAGTIRAVRWVVKGEPAGEAFLHTVYGPDGETVKRQASEAGVEITLDNGVTVRKTRKSGKTKYWVLPLYDEPFEKAEVPEVVKEALGIKSSRFGDFEADLHFAYQLAAPFLISEPASAGAKVLGKLAGTEAIDGAIKSTAKDTYAARQDKQAADKEYERKAEQLKAFEGLEEVQRQLDACEWLLVTIDETLEKKTKLENLVTLHEGIQKDLREAATTLETLAHVPVLEDDLAEIQKAQQQYERLLDLHESLGKATATVETLTQQLRDLEGLDACEWLLFETETAEVRRANLIELMQQYTKHNADVKTAVAVITATQDLDVLKHNTELIHMALDRLSNIRSLRQSYEMLQEQVTRYEKIRASLAGIPDAEALITTADERMARLAKLREAYSIFCVKGQTLEIIEGRAVHAEKDMKVAKKELSDAWNAAGGICPLCEQAVAHSH